MSENLYQKQVDELIEEIRAHYREGVTDQTTAKMLEAYQTAYEIIMENGLPVAPLTGYIELLDYQGLITTAVEVGNALAKRYVPPHADNKAYLAFACAYGSALVDGQEYNKANAVLLDALEVAQASFEKEGKEYAEYIAELENCYSVSLFYYGAKKMGIEEEENGLKYAEIAYEYAPTAKNALRLAILCDNHAQAFYIEGEKGYKKAIEYTKRAIRLANIAEKAGYHKAKKCLSLHYTNLSAHHLRLKKYDIAGKYILKALKIRTKLLQANPKEIERIIGHTYRMVANHYNRMGDEKTAAEYTQKDLELAKRLRGESSLNDRNVYNAYSNLFYGNYPEKIQHKYRGEYLFYLWYIEDKTYFERQNFAEEVALFVQDENNGESNYKNFAYLRKAYDYYLKDGKSYQYFHPEEYFDILEALAIARDEIELYEYYVNAVKGTLPKYEPYEQLDKTIDEIETLLSELEQDLEDKK